jgi:hypothetical protein
MRITPEILIEIAREYVDEYISSHDDLIAAYLSGSVLSKNHLLGGSTDIDIILIKDVESEKREIIKMSPDIHLDIVTHPKKYYQPPKTVRLHPFLSYAINQCLPLMDDNHFIDFTQAGVRSGFDSPKNRYDRAYPLLKEARKKWLSIEMNDSVSIQEMIPIYLDSLTLLSQSFAILHQGPISQRNFFPSLRSISEENSFSEIHIGVMGLLGGNQIDVATLFIWQSEWQNFLSLVNAQPDYSPQFHPSKITYYQRALDALHNTESPIDGLWLLISIWVDAQKNYSEISTDLYENLHVLGFSKENLPNKQKGLDALLDLTEEWFEKWKYQFGV